MGRNRSPSPTKLAFRFRRRLHRRCRHQTRIDDHIPPTIAATDPHQHHEGRGRNDGSTPNRRRLYRPTTNSRWKRLARCSRHDRTTTNSRRRHRKRMSRIPRRGPDHSRRQYWPATNCRWTRDRHDGMPRHRRGPDSRRWFRRLRQGLFRSPRPDPPATGKSVAGIDWSLTSRQTLVGPTSRHNVQKSFHEWHRITSLGYGVTVWVLLLLPADPVPP